MGVMFRLFDPSNPGGWEVDSGRLPEPLVFNLALNMGKRERESDTDVDKSSLTRLTLREGFRAAFSELTHDELASLLLISRPLPILPVFPLPPSKRPDLSCHHFLLRSGLRFYEAYLSRVAH